MFFVAQFLTIWFYSLIFANQKYVRDEISVYKDSGKDRE